VARSFLTQDAARELRKALEIKPDFLEARFMLAVCLHGLGHHHAAVAEYTSVVNAHTPPADKDTSLLQHLAYYQRECARFARAELDTPLTPMFLDLLLHETFKEAWCKKLPPSVLTGASSAPLHVSFGQAGMRINTPSNHTPPVLRVTIRSDVWGHCAYTSEPHQQLSGVCVCVCVCVCACVCLQAPGTRRRHHCRRTTTAA
jgi:hypothetical protein